MCLWSYPRCFLFRGLRPPDLPLGRTGGRAGDPLYPHFVVSLFPAHILHIVFSSLFEGLQALGGISSFFLVKFHVECHQNHVCGPPGARVMSIFIKTYIFVKIREGKGREKGKEKRERKGEN